ncbi:sugar-binding protein [Bacteroidota bacterium]
MRYYQYLLLIIFLITTFRHSLALNNTNSDKPILRVTKIDSPIEITGRLDDPVWSSADPVSLTFEFLPGENIQAKEKTFVKVLYNDEFIYVGFECHDSNPNEIRANITDRDKIWNDDLVYIVFDTYNDYQKGYEFYVNPYGIQGDMLATRNGEDEGLDFIWESAANINGHGWTAEMSIPFSSLTFPNKEEHTWSVNIGRNIPRLSLTKISWTPRDRNIPGFLTQGGLMTGLKNIKSAVSFELLPYAMGLNTGAIADLANPNSDFIYNDFMGRIGGSLKYSPSSNLTIHGVINPDFSQVESDADQISINTTFALSYPEKRPFFLGGSELFNTPMYYSRSINNPLAAGRIIGKSGSLSYMYLSAYDRNTVFFVPGEEESDVVQTSQKSFANIGRLRYDLGDENYIGGMLMTRNMSGGHNYVFGFDWNYKFWNNWYFNGEGFLIQTQELNDSTLVTSDREFGDTGHTAALDGEKYLGTGLHLVLSHEQRSYNFYVVANIISPTFQSYNGFFNSTNFQQFGTEHQFNFYPEDSFIDRGELAVFSNLQFNFEGLKKEQVLQTRVSLLLKGQTGLSFYYFWINDERFFDKHLKGVNRGRITLDSKPISEISLMFDGQVGKFIYRTENPTIGTGHILNAVLTLKPTSKLNLTFSYDRARLSSIETNQIYFDGNIYRLVGIYQFNNEIFFRTILQYNSFSKMFTVYPLFSYKLNAFTTFYAGATSDYLDYKGEFGFVNTGQQYFVKLQYLIGM